MKIEIVRPGEPTIEVAQTTTWAVVLYYKYLLQEGHNTFELTNVPFTEDREDQEYRNVFNVYYDENYGMYILTLIKYALMNGNIGIPKSIIEFDFTETLYEQGLFDLKKTDQSTNGEKVIARLNFQELFEFDQEAYELLLMFRQTIILALIDRIKEQPIFHPLKNEIKNLLMAVICEEGLAETIITKRISL